MYLGKFNTSTRSMTTNIIPSMDVRRRFESHVLYTANALIPFSKTYLLLICRQMRWQSAVSRRRCLVLSFRGYSSAADSRLHSIKGLRDWDVANFKSFTNNLQTPTVLPRTGAPTIPAAQRWFLNLEDTNACELRNGYLDQFKDTQVPLELTSAVAAGHVEFRRTHAPLSLFLNWIRDAPIDVKHRIYLAQCQLMDLPDQLRQDLPTPDVVLRAGKGDIYDANVWIGRAPTYTPLHRDPNPNLFYQLAGKKIVRMFPPDVGDAIYSQVRNELGGLPRSVSLRGEEMMAGAERIALEKRVWSESEESLANEGCQEALLEYGQALFIPLRWWHSIKGLGTGVTASVNWWFR